MWPFDRMKERAEERKRQAFRNLCLRAVDRKQSVNARWGAVVDMARTIGTVNRSEISYGGMQRGYAEIQIGNRRALFCSHLFTDNVIEGMGEQVANVAGLREVWDAVREDES